MIFTKDLPSLFASPYFASEIIVTILLFIVYNKTR